MNIQATKPIESNLSNKVKSSANKDDAAKFPTMRIYESTATALEKLSDQINGTGPKRVQWKDIVEIAVSKIAINDLKKLREEKLTASDRFEEMFRAFKVKNPDASRDEFLSKLMTNVDLKNFQN